MANKEISELTAATSPLDGTEPLMLTQTGNSRKATVLQLLTPTLLADDQGAVRTAFGVPLRGHLFGLGVSNNASDATNDIDIAAGEAASQQTPGLLMAYAGGSGIQLDVAYGTGSGGRFDASISDGTWHVFLISNGTTVARGFSKSLDPTGQANYPSGYTHYRRIFSVIRVLGAIRPFMHTLDWVNWKIVTADYYSASPGTSAIVPALAVPVGLKVRARVSVNAAGGEFFYISDLDANDLTPSPSVMSISASGNPGGGTVEVTSNVNTQIRLRCQAGINTVTLSTIGYFDDRGQSA
ncbi:MAG: hypothetical protein ACOH2M_17160 [Cypionkella sp.]